MEANHAKAINLTIARNLAQARHLRGMTQAEAVEKMNELWDEDWSPNTLSLAESAAGGKRVRAFTVTQLVTFAQVYGVPVGYFLLPTDDPDALDISLKSPFDPRTLDLLLNLTDNIAVQLDSGGALVLDRARAVQLVGLGVGLAAVKGNLCVHPGLNVAQVELPCNIVLALPDTGTHGLSTAGPTATVELGPRSR